MADGQRDTSNNQYVPSKKVQPFLPSPIDNRIIPRRVSSVKHTPALISGERSKSLVKDQHTRSPLPSQAVRTAGSTFPGRRSPYIEHALSVNNINAAREQVREGLHLYNGKTIKGKSSASVGAGPEECKDNDTPANQQGRCSTINGLDWIGDQTNNMYTVPRAEDGASTHFTSTNAVAPGKCLSKSAIGMYPKSYPHMMSIVESLRQLRRPSTAATNGRALSANLVVSGQAPNKKDPVLAWVRRSDRANNNRISIPNETKLNPSPAHSDSGSASGSDLDDVSEVINMNHDTESHVTRTTNQSDENYLCSGQEYRSSQGQMLKYYMDRETSESSRFRKRDSHHSRQSPPQQQQQVQRPRLPSAAESHNKLHLSRTRESSHHSPSLTNRASTEGLQPRAKSGKLFLGRQLNPSPFTKCEGRSELTVTSEPVNPYISIHKPAQLIQRKPLGEETCGPECVSIDPSSIRIPTPSITENHSKGSGRSYSAKAAIKIGLSKPYSGTKVIRHKSAGVLSQSPRLSGLKDSKESRLNYCLIRQKKHKTMGT